MGDDEVAATRVELDGVEADAAPYFFQGAYVFSADTIWSPFTALDERVVEALVTGMELTALVTDAATGLESPTPDP